MQQIQKIGCGMTILGLLLLGGVGGCLVCAASVSAATSFLVPKNNAEGELSTGVNAAATTLVLDTGDGANFPSTYDYHIVVDSEIMKVTNRSSDTLTVTRAQESTSAVPHAAGAAVYINVTAEYLSQVQTAVNALENIVLTGSLDDAFDNGNTIDGAVTGTRLQAGDGTDGIEFWGSSNTANLTTFGTSDLVIAPDGGDTDITGTLGASGAFDAASAAITGAITGATLDLSSTLELGSGNLTVSNAGGELLSQHINWAANDAAIDIGAYTFTANALVSDTTLAVTGNTTLTGDLAVNGDDITADGNLTVDGSLQCGGSTWLKIKTNSILNNSGDQLWAFSGQNITMPGDVTMSAGVHAGGLKSGTTQGGAGAAANELWVDTDDDNTVKRGS